MKIGFDEMSRAIDRYNKELKKEEWRKPQNESTFFNSGYIDYLDDNYEEGTVKFKKFEQRNYNESKISELETKLNGI